MPEGLLKSAAVPVPSSDPYDPAVPARVVTVASESSVSPTPPQDASIAVIKMMIHPIFNLFFMIPSIISYMFGMPDFRFDEFNRNIANEYVTNMEEMRKFSGELK
jgi:hypothetical protein